MPLYDEDTGFTAPAAEAEALKVADKEAYEEAHDIAEMSQTAGWRRLEAYYAAKIAQLKDALVDERDPLEICRLQQSVKAYSHVVGIVRTMVEQKRLLQEQSSQQEKPAA